MNNTTIYTYLPGISAEIPKILSNLGRPTKRGIKKCPKCGVYNGTRGMVCKNKQCDAIFKDCADKRKLNLDAVRLTGIVRQVYSVRVKDRGPDHRGFVQLPLLPSSTSEERNNLSENALCFVDSCQRLFDDSILKCHEETSNSTPLICVHIDSAIKSENLAKPIEFKKEILNSLKVSQEVKEKLWSLVTEKEGPLVQRVSRTVVAVKCQVSPKHPLGYLHFTFGCTKGRDIYDKYYCSCTEFMVSGSVNKFNNAGMKCIHYYACICALSSDEKCSEEFSDFINIELPRTKNQKSQQPEKNAGREEKNLKNQQKVDEGFNNNKKMTKNQAKPKNCCQPNKRHHKLLAPKIFPVEIKILEDIEQLDSLSERNDNTSWSFRKWLSYVTESINQTMKFENYGILNNLIFCIPEIFYIELKKKIPALYTENQVYANTYRIMNILDVKQIFDTPDVKLKISKRFVHDEQKGYVEYNEEESECCQTNFIFFLNVGQSTVDESDSTNNPFFIEWIPNVTSLTRIGQLKLQYKYGRKST